MSYCSPGASGKATYTFRDEYERCDYCGAIHPDAFMQMIRNGLEVVPTDKNYKAYIMAPTGQEKFYYEHLSDAQKTEFVELLNAKAIKLAFPGHFYILPYFLGRA